MKYKILGIIFCILINRSYSLTVGQCDVTDNGEIDHLDILNKTIKDVEELNINYPTVGDLTVDLSTGDEQTAAKYVDIVWADNNLSIKTNDYFKEFESDQEHVDINAATKTLDREFTLYCGSDSAVITLKLTVTDTNNHAPVFDLTTFKYTLSSPLTPLVDLSSAGDQIYVTDLDFSNSNITFTVDPPGNFVVDTIPVSGSPRKYRGVLKVTEYTTLPKTTSLTITATDNGTPEPKSGTAEISIEVDSDSSLADKPSLSQALYRFDYDADENSLTPATGQKIKITASNTEDNIEVKILDEAGVDSLYFKASYDPSTMLVTIETTNTKLEPSSDSLLVLTLEVFYTGKDKDVSTSVILIQLPTELVAKPPTFSAPYYRTTYNIDGETATLDPAVTFTVSDENANVTFIEANENFEVIPISDGTGYEVSVVEELSTKILLSESDIVLTLQAKTEGFDQVSEATLVISLPKETTPFKFSETVYEATYKTNSDPDKDEVTTEEITIDSSYPTNELQVKLIPPNGYEDYFDVSTSSPYKITVTNNLEANILQEGKDIVLTLDATFDNDVVATALVKVVLPEIPASPKFTLPTYTAKYTTDNKIEFDEVISIDPNDPDKVKVEVESKYSKTFVLAYDKTKKGYLVSVDKSNPLDFENMSESVIYVSLTATVEGAKSSGSATLAVQLPEKTNSIVPEFSQTAYTAQYLSNNTVSETNPKIEIVSDSSTDTTVQVTGDYASNFEAVIDGTSWKLNVIKELEDKRSTIGVSLEAALSGSAGNGYATVILTMPGDLKAAPAFKELWYTATYIVNGDNTVEVTADPIIITSTDGQPTVTLGSYETNFDLTYDESIKGWKLSVTDQLLDQEILNSQTQLVITLKATLENSVADDFATLVIQLPKHETISFEQTHYQVTYTENTDSDDDELSGETVLTVNDGVNISISPAEYQENFNVSCEAGKCTLLVAKDLDHKVLEENTEIILVLEATKSNVDGIGTAVILITLPLQEKAKSPEFTQTVYTLSYDNTGSVTTKDTIKILGDATDVEVTFGDDKIGNSSVTEYFTIIKKDDYWEVTVAKTLTEDILKSEPALTFTLVATKSNVSASGQAALVVKLPKQQGSSTSFNFKESVYQADYEIDDASPRVTVEGDIEIEGANITDVKVTVKEEDYKKYFTSSIDEDGKVTVVTDEVLDGQILNQNAAVTITLVASSVSESTEAIVVVKLPRKVSQTSIYFESGAYVVDYSVDNNKPTLKPESDIVIKNDDGTATVFLSGNNSNYFKYSYTDGKVIVSLENETSSLPNDVINGQSFISFDIVAVKNNETTTTKLVIKLPAAEAEKSFDFSNTVFMANYETDSASSNLRVESEIKIEGDIADVEVDIEEEEYEQYFTTETNKTNGIVTINTIDVLASDILDQKTAFTITLVATANSESHKTAVVIKLPRKISNTSIYFESGAYVADYKVENDKPNLTLESNIVLANDVEGKAEITLTGDNAMYFDCEYADDRTVSVSLKSDTVLPDDVIKDKSLISVDIKASTGNETTSETTSAKLIIKLPKAQSGDVSDDDGDGEDTTGLIAAVSVLAVLLVASLVGSAVFYYLKFKRGGTVENLFKNIGSFKKSKTVAEHPVEHPTRRPTGVIRYELENEGLNDTSDDTQEIITNNDKKETVPNLEKRKSVQFDTINVDELEIEKTEDDTDDDYIENEDSLDVDDDGNDRRSSRV